MRKRKTILVGLLGFLAAGAAFGGVLCGMAWLVGPGEPLAYSQQQLREARQAATPHIDPNDPLVLYRQVDYAEGPKAAWYPKGQSPALAELVRRGALPGVAQRVGGEPAVVEGVEGIGRYGGTWVRAGTNDNDVFGVLGHRMSYCTLVRWSPRGYPIVPHVARAYEASDDCRRYTFHLRKGMRWSDGQPFTADDILFWWEHEAKDELLSRGSVPTIMKVAGQPGEIRKVDDHCIEVTFPRPNGLFLPKIATFAGRYFTGTPAHYLRPYHPTVGDADLIEQVMAAEKLPSPLAVYRFVKDNTNPDHPRLWPWIHRTRRPNPPYGFVRNPYYWMVDTRGNQLPYIDRLHFEVKSSEMIAVSAANGELTMQARHLNYNAYTLLMRERERSGFDVVHWYSGDRSQFVISPNLNRKVEPNEPGNEDAHRETANKHALLNERKFRQALSLAINRQDIIDGEFHGQAEPAQCAPGPASYFHEPRLYRSFTEYDPKEAGRLLDELGLTRRDEEGCRTFRDGTKMTFYLNLAQGGIFAAGPAQFVIEDWAKVGVRVLLRLRSRQLFYQEKASLEHDFNVWGGNGEFIPILEPRYFLPFSGESNYAIGFANWYDRGGLYGDERAQAPGCVEPPEDHPLRRAMEIYEQVVATGDKAAQRERFGEVLRLAAENVWTLSICTPPPTIAVARRGLRNVPKDAVYSWDFQSPANAGVETYFFEAPESTPGAVRQMHKAILREPLDRGAEAGAAVGRVVRWLFGGIAVLLVALVGLKHPYVGRRLIIMVPTLLVISLVVFTIIQLPPGDYLTTRIMTLQQSGDTADLQQVMEIKDQFFLDDPYPVQYARWLGLRWLWTFDRKDQGLLQGNLGRSMENSKPVNEIVGDRILLTVLISLGTILFTWALAIPTGIYSAVRQYSVGDYVLTFVGFIGMCVPGFLLALVLMYASKEFLGIEVSGLFSSQYGAQPDWDWPKVVNLLEHIWVPVAVLGVGGTAGMIRVMRGNLLDELRKPYVITARAKGVRPLKLLLKYPVRMALNPFISGIGHLFPQLVSGGAIVAMVLSLPTVGPLLLNALMSEDMYLAGSMLMVLSLLGVFGTLVSDLLLLWLDPRIRYEGGGR